MIRLKRLWRSFIYAGRGVLKVWREEQNFKIESLTALVAVVLAWRLGFSLSDWAVLLLAIGLVLIMEIINSAVEAISDCLKPRLDNYVKRIKDVVAAGVLLAALTAFLIGVLLFIKYCL